MRLNPLLAHADEQMFVYEGFLVEKPPSIAERLLLKSINTFSIPRYTGEEEEEWTNKLRVFRSELGWQVQVIGILKSELPFVFASHESAMLFVSWILTLKEKINEKN